MLLDYVVYCIPGPQFLVCFVKFYVYYYKINVHFVASIHPKEP